MAGLILRCLKKASVYHQLDSICSGVSESFFSIGFARLACRGIFKNEKIPKQSSVLYAILHHSLKQGDIQVILHRQLIYSYQKKVNKLTSDKKNPVNYR